MKRVFGMMTLAALLAVGSVSCKKAETNSSFTFGLPTVEGVWADEGKAYIDMVDGNKMKWYDGDQMMIYSVDATNTTPTTGVFTADAGSTGATVAHFNGPQMTAGSYGYFAFYPADKAVSVSADNYATFEVSNTQTYDKNLNFTGSYAGRILMDPRGVVAASTCAVLNGNTTVMLNHIFGFANVRVKSTSGATKNVKSVSIRDNKKNLTGEITIQIPAITDARLSALQTLGTNYANGSITQEAYLSQLNSILHEMGYSAQPNGNVVTLDCSDYAGGAVPINNKNKYFFIPLRPGALIDSFTVTLTYDDNTTKEFNFNGNTNRQYVIRPGWINNIQVEI